MHEAGPYVVFIIRWFFFSNFFWVGGNEISDMVVRETQYALIYKLLKDDCVV